jgi:Ni/Fe-hydrogenase 1 B-type cytochrome subunit
MLKRVYVWELPVRLTHWVNAAAIIVLCGTGFYIGFPFISPLPYYPPRGFPIMSTMRLIHLVSAYVFTISFFIRIYWFFVGNQYARWGDYIPLTRKAWGDILDDVRFYLFVKKDIPHRAGHHALAALTYLALFFFYHLEIITGFALDSMSHHGWVYHLQGGWFLPYVPSPALRLYHHLFMWGVIVFAIVHVYIGWIIDLKERNGIISSIFSGYKVLDGH